jgi:ribosome modulation factor
MLRTLWILPLLMVLGVTPVLLTPTQAYAQNDARERAYQAGFQNGVNDRRQNKPLNLKTDNWKGENLQVYQKGYESGYRSGERGGYGGGGYGDNRGYGDRGPGAYGQGGPYPSGGYGQNDARQRAFQAGFQNGVNDRRQNKPLNLKTDNWKGENLEAYRKGYEEGYRSGERGGHHY